MPAALVEQMAKQADVSLDEAEALWDKAKQIAARKFTPSDTQFYPYVTGVFKNMLSISAAAAVEPSKWWLKLPEDKKSAYIQKHPGSKYAKEHNRLKNTVKRAVKRKTKQVVESAKTNVKTAGRSVSSVMNGTATPEQRTLVKKLAVGFAMAALGGLVLAAAFTPLGGYAMEVGEQFLREWGSKFADLDASSESSDDGQDVDPDVAALDKFQADLSNWIVSQDPEKLLDIVKAERAKKEKV